MTKPKSIFIVAPTVWLSLVVFGLPRVQGADPPPRRASDEEFDTRVPPPPQHRGAPGGMMPRGGMRMDMRGMHQPRGMRGPGFNKEFGKFHKEMESLQQKEDDLDNRTHELADQYRDAPTDKQSDIKSELEKVVEQQFDVRQERRALELKRLEEELKRIRGSIDKRKEARKQIVSHRVSELLEEEEAEF